MSPVEVVESTFVPGDATLLHNTGRTTSAVGIGGGVVVVVQTVIAASINVNESVVHGVNRRRVRCCCGG